MNQQNFEDEEMERQRALATAVQAADRVILEYANGDPDELLVLTAELAVRFTQKIAMMANAELLRQRIWNHTPATTERSTEK